MDNPEYEQYGLSEQEWNALTEEGKDAYRGVGSEENQSQMEEDGN